MLSFSGLKAQVIFLLFLHHFFQCCKFQSIFPLPVILPVFPTVKTTFLLHCNSFLTYIFYLVHTSLLYIPVLQLSAFFQAPCQLFLQHNLPDLDNKLLLLYSPEFFQTKALLLHMNLSVFLLLPIKSCQFLYHPAFLPLFFLFHLQKLIFLLFFGISSAACFLFPYTLLSPQER